MESISSLDIAIVGLACRYPGDARDSKSFLDMLKNGRDAWSKIPKDRFDIDKYYHPSHERQGNIIAQGGYFLKDDVSTFDAPFFSMTTAEANAMDPQHRLVLESTYEAFESAGMPLQKLVGSDTSVYVGCFTRDYEAVSAREMSNLLLYQATGQGLAMLSNRLSWFFDLHGPSLTLDTACSSSLLALHLACQSIRSGESKMSVVGGVGLILLPDTMRILTQLHFLSPDSRCYSFDERANGYARGEGFATMVLKPVADAIRDGDTIRAVIRGTGSNQDGHTPGITLPSSEAQAKLIADTYRLAGLRFKDTQYFEAHGTGTPAGDPLELGAMGTTFGAETETRSQPLYVGSVKTNIGHLEGGAGLAGVMKAIHSVEQGYIFPSLNYEKPNPRLKLKEWNVKIPTELTPWPTTGTRRASINSFGYGGSNVHCIIDDAYHYLKERNLQGFHNTIPFVPELNPAIDNGIDSGIGSDASSGDDEEHAGRPKIPAFYRKKLFVLSARNEEALGRMDTAYSAYIKEKVAHGKVSKFLDDLAHTLGTRRSVFAWKQTVIASSTKELTSALSNAAIVRSGKTPRLAFVFTGQGAQWYAMGRELMEHQAYAESVYEADIYLKSIGSSWSVLEALYASKEVSRVNEPEFSQPLCTVLQVALVKLLAHWGVEPSAVVGHSSGEIAAAYAAGALTSQDAWRVAYYRGRVTKHIAEVKPDLKGGMLAVGLSEEDARKYLADLTAGSAVIACINSPASVTISGDVEALQDLQTRLTADGAFNRRLMVANAYHSPHMECVAEEYREAIADIEPRSVKPGCVFHSSVTGAVSDGALLDANYWCSNMINPVKFLHAMQSMFPDPTAKRRQRQKNGAPANTFVEIGPSGALQGPLRDIISTRDNKDDLTILSILARGKDAIDTSLTTIGKLWSMGLPGIKLDNVNNPSINHPKQQSLCDAPSYPWNHSTRYWHESTVSYNHRFPRSARLDVLGAPSDEWNPTEPIWKNRLKISELPWVREHQVLGSIIFPAAGFLCAVLEGARQIADKTKTAKSYELRDIVVGRALAFDGDTDVVELVTAFKPRKLGLRGRDAPWIEWTLYSNSEKGHMEHCSGLLCIHYEQVVSQIEGGREEQLRKEKLLKEYQGILAASQKSIEPKELYAVLKGIGLQYGPLFQGITTVKSDGQGSGCTTITISDTKAVMAHGHEYEHLLHPCTLDAVFQSVFVAFVGQQKGGKLQAMVPTAIESLKFAAVQPKGAGATYNGFAQGVKKGFREAQGRVCMADEHGAPLIEMEGFACTELGALTGGQASDQDADDAIDKVQHYWSWNADPFCFTQEQVKNAIMVPQDEYDYGHETYLAQSTDMEKLAAIFSKRALKGLNAEVEEKLPVHLKCLVDWMKNQHQLARQGMLPLQKRPNEWIDLTDEQEEEFINEQVDRSIDTKMLVAIGRELNNILDGSVMALSVMMRDNMLLDIYSESWGMDVSRQQWKKLFELYGHKTPNMKILEVGAGSASITVPILEGLGAFGGSSVRCLSYVFTDISSGFFEPAQKKLKPWSNVITYKKLDIESDPIAQGYEAESFDCINATNVLHATKNIDNTLQNCMKLLKPGGHLIIGEIVAPKARLSLMYGTLPGWWLSEDGRTGGPLLTDEQWNEAFKRNGLTPDFTVWDLPDKHVHTLSVLCATKKVAPEYPFNRILVVDDGKPSAAVSAFSQGLKKALSPTGLPVERASLAEIGAVEVTPEENPLADTAIISLLEAETPFFMTLDAEKLKSAQNMLLRTAHTLWITKGDRLCECDPAFRLVDGVLRTLRNEDSALRLHTLDFTKSLPLESDEAVGVVMHLFSSFWNIAKGDRETEVAYKEGEYHIPRVYDDVPKNKELRTLHSTRPPVTQPLKQEGRPLKMTIAIPGMLDTLHWVDDEEASLPAGPNEVKVAIKSAAMNFVDIMVSMGIIPDSTLGCDGAGDVVEVGPGVTHLKPGDRVVLFEIGTYRSIVRARKELVHKIPEKLSYDEAATLPAIYITAYQSLVEIGHLHKGESILIHAAAGGLGQAAIQLAKYIGAEIFVTVGSLAKKDLIMESYGIPEDHIFNSRDLTFADAVLRATNGKGVDMALNSLAGEALRKTWSCVKDFGRFIEVGKKDILANSGLEMLPFLRNITFAGVNCEHMVRHYPEIAGKVGEKVFALVRAGHVGIVNPVTVFGMADMEKAFRMMQQGKHTGKIVLSMEGDDIEVPVVPRDQHPLKLREDKTYLLVGGLGGLGRAQAIWLAENGAKHLAFFSRSGAASAAATKTMAQLEAMNVTAKAYACDVSKEEVMAKALAKMATELPPVAGVIQGAMVLSDSMFHNMKYEDWIAAWQPKVAGSWNLHKLLPKDMDFFIMLSSLSGSNGSRGQSNYAAGNTFQQGLAHHRHSHGLAATVLDLGFMAGFGFVEEQGNSALIKNMSAGLDKMAIEPDKFYSILKSSITGYTGDNTLMPVQATIGCGTGGMIRAKGLEDKFDNYWHEDIKYSYLRHLDTLASSNIGNEGDSEFRAAIAGATSLADAVEIIQDALRTKLAKAIMIPIEDIDISKPISAFGVDSLVAVEVRNWVSREIKSDLSVFDILSPVPMSQLIQKLALKSTLVPLELKAEAGEEGGEELAAAVVAADDSSAAASDAKEITAKVTDPAEPIVA